MIAPAVVNEQEIGVDRFREQDGRTLSGVEARERIVRRNRDRQRENFEPSGRALHPASHGEWCGGVREFVADFGGDVNFLKGTPERLRH